VGAGGGGAPFVDQGDGDPGGLGFVAQDGDEVADAPVAGPPVVPPPGGQGEDAAGVADREGAGPAGGSPAHNDLGGFVLGLADPPPVPGLG